MNERVGQVTSIVAEQTVLRMASRLKDGRLTATMPDGRRRVYGEPGGLEATIRIHDRSLFKRLLLGGEIGFGEAYVDGLWDSDDLVGLLTFAVHARKTLQFNATWLSTLSTMKNLALHRSRNNTHRQARDNIHAHYDLGNEFFRLWLDESMTYSCAYFAHPDDSLEAAQQAKYSKLCKELRLGPSDHLLEIGSGWGSLAIYAAQQFGCRVTSITISEEQLKLARQRVEDAGLSSRVEVAFCDYRDVSGRFEKIVSVEMFEAVGAEYFPAFFEACNRALTPGGLLAMQTIAVPDRAFAAMRDGVNWVQKYIFPGGMLPSISEIERAMVNTDFVITSLDEIGLHYATTLRAWRRRFLERVDGVRALGFDERFVRMWEYYLAACEAGFLTRNTLDYQMVLERPAPAVGAGPLKAQAPSDGERIGATI